MIDARFEDGADQPLRLAAQDAADLEVMSSLAQDAVFPVEDMQWDRRRRRLAILLNRFRWEDLEAARRQGRSPERVRAVLDIGDVRSVASQGFERGAGGLVLSLLALTFEPGPDGQGAVVLTLSGDGAIRVEVECLDITLTDATRPYAAPSGKAPHHPD